MKSCGFRRKRFPPKFILVNAGREWCKGGREFSKKRAEFAAKNGRILVMKIIVKMALFFLEKPVGIAAVLCYNFTLFFIPKDGKKS